MYCRHNVNYIWKNEYANQKLHTHSQVKCTMVLGTRTSSFSSKSVRISGSNEFYSCCCLSPSLLSFLFHFSLVMRQQLFFYPPYMAISIIHNPFECVCDFTITLYYIDSLCTPTSDLYKHRASIFYSFCILSESPNAGDIVTANAEHATWVQINYLHQS